MKYYSELKQDPRFENYGVFVQKVMGVLDLSDEACEEVINPIQKIAKDAVLYDVLKFMTSAKKLMICGDYDCDGVTSTSIAVLLAKKLGVEVGYYIPNRITEGYGTSVNTLRLALEKGYDSVMMVDNGVKAHEAIEFAHEHKMKICIVDHHSYDVAPDVDVFVHPRVLGEYCDSMCAAGLMAVICETNGYLDDYILALGCVGTIGDVMPLWKKNRELVRRGLLEINKQRFLTLNTLIKENGSLIDAQTIAYQVVPKLNAIGRLADMVNVNTLVSYLISTDERLVLNYSAQIESVNTIRKSKSQELKELAITSLTNDPVNILEGDAYHEGLLGIVANQLTTLTGKPTMIFQRVEEGYKGSARSKTVSLNELFSKLDPNYFIAYGGHDFAFGMTVKHTAFKAFTDDVMTEVVRMDVIDQDEPIIIMDEPISGATWDSLKPLEPFGTGFQVPLFALKIPNETRLVPIGTVGTRFVFKDFWLRSAVTFSVNVDPITFVGKKWLVGRFSNSTQYGLSFTAESIL